MMATGGGAYKYYDRMREVLGVEVLREDEMECLIIGVFLQKPPCTACDANVVAGLDFFITEIPNEVFTYSESDPMHFAEARTDIYPYLLVNIGSGVSMIKVSGPKQYDRIGGTSLGGGTLWGLLSLLTGARTFDEMLGMAEKGDNSAVDMLVGDIYGTDYSKIGLKSSTIASSFGKVFKMKRLAEDDAEDGGGLANGDRAQVVGASDSQRNFAPEDISRSLLYAIRYFNSKLCRMLSLIYQQQHRPDCVSAIRKAQSRAYLLRRFFYPWTPPDHEHAIIRHQVLV